MRLVHSSNKILKLFFIVIVLSISTAIYSFSLTDINGKTYNKKDLSNKFIIVNFWATWCPPCLREIPSLVEFYDNNANSVVIIGINYWDELKSNILNDFIDFYMINYPIIVAKDDNYITKNFGNLKGLPTTFIYDKQGKLITKLEQEINLKILNNIIFNK